MFAELEVDNSEEHPNIMSKSAFANEEFRNFLLCRRHRN